MEEVSGIGGMFSHDVAAAPRRDRRGYRRAGYPNGLFARLRDPESNPIELCEPGE